MSKTCVACLIRLIWLIILILICLHEFIQYKPIRQIYWIYFFFLFLVCLFISNILRNFVATMNHIFVCLFFFFLALLVYCFIVCYFPTSISGDNKKFKTSKSIDDKKIRIFKFFIYSHKYFNIKKDNFVSVDMYFCVEGKLEVSESEGRSKLWQDKNLLPAIKC